MHATSVLWTNMSYGLKTSTIAVSVTNAALYRSLTEDLTALHTMVKRKPIYLLLALTGPYGTWKSMSFNVNQRCRMSDGKLALRNDAVQEVHHGLKAGLHNFRRLVLRMHAAHLQAFTLTIVRRSQGPAYGARVDDG